MAQNLLALPAEDGTMTFWQKDAAFDAPQAVVENVESGLAGQCYRYDREAGQLLPSQGVNCLDYLLRDTSLPTRAETPYAITGVPEFIPGPLSETSNGFRITQVPGVENCGERADCDVIYVRGVLSTDLIAPLVAAARNGTLMRIEGPGVWHLESIDIVIESMTPAE